jgi:DNA polymerase III alpha subunit
MWLQVSVLFIGVTLDVDIDVNPSFKPLSVFTNWIRASRVQDGQLLAHNVGIYPQAIAVDPLTGLAAIPYEDAEELGYLKVDFLPLHVYKHFNTRDEIDELLGKEPDWKLLLVRSNHEKIFQLAKHGDLLVDLKPSSVLELADIMALIRPGKKNFIGLYKKDREAGRRILYAKDDSGYTFKKSHALAYSYVVVLQLHLIEQGKL